MQIDQLFAERHAFPTADFASVIVLDLVTTSVAKHATDGPADGTRLNRHASWYFRQLDALACDE